MPRLDEVPAVQPGAPVLVLMGILHIAGVFGEHVFPPTAQDHLKKQSREKKGIFTIICNYFYPRFPNSGLTEGKTEQDVQENPDVAQNTQGISPRSK